MKNINHTRSSISDDIRNILCSSANMRRAIPLILRLLRSEERFSRNAETDLVCRLLLEKKKQNNKTYLRPNHVNVIDASGCLPPKVRAADPASVCVLRA